MIGSLLLGPGQSFVRDASIVVNVNVDIPEPCPDAYIAKVHVSSNTSNVVFATYLGGDTADQATALAVGACHPRSNIPVGTQYSDTESVSQAQVRNGVQLRPKPPSSSSYRVLYPTATRYRESCGLHR